MFVTVYLLNFISQVNGTDEVKKEDATSPMPGPGEIENMTVVDEVS